MTPKTNRTDPITSRVKELRDYASVIRKEASKLESFARALGKARSGEFIVFEDTSNKRMPVQMGIYEGISCGLGFAVRLKNAAYIIIDQKTGEYSLRNDRTELLFHAIVGDSIRRNIGGESTIPAVHRELKESKEKHTANEVLQKYGFSVKQYRELFL